MAIKITEIYGCKDVKIKKWKKYNLCWNALLMIMECCWMVLEQWEGSSFDFVGVSVIDSDFHFAGTEQMISNTS